jgi:hypothetical protein
MSLGKSPTLTPARLEANRRNARKPTGPRTARGKAQSRMNSLRSLMWCGTGQGGSRPAPTCPPDAVDRAARATLTPEQAAHPLLAETVDIFREAEISGAEHYNLHGPTPANTRWIVAASGERLWRGQEGSKQYAAGALCEPRRQAPKDDSARLMERMESSSFWQVWASRACS